MAKAEASHDAAGARHRKAEAAHTAAKAIQTRAKEELEAAEGKLADLPSRKEVEGVLANIRGANEDVADAKDRESQASKRVKTAAARLAELKQHPDADWRPYHRTRDELAAMDPPKPSPDLFSSWKELAVWAKDKIPAIDNEIRCIDEQAVRHSKKRDERRAMLVAAFKTHDVSFGDNPLASLAAAQEKARAALENARKTLKEKRQLKRSIKKTQAEVAVSETLWTHLNAVGFEKWLLAEAFRGLSDHASDILKRLSNDQYSFRHSGSEFEVVDHANAGEARSARTLSGGETFLASLSLALALADQVADLATEGTARLESIFLDEGFGTLDPDTLEVVTNTIEELGASGRMVGVVTHVHELAQRMPVRFKVYKASGTAHVDRIET